MPDATLIVRNPSGLHARPAATFVKAAAAFRSAVSVTNLTRDPDRAAAARSLLSILGLGVSCGHEIRIAADGEDAEQAVATLRRLVEAGLGEPVNDPQP